MSSLTKRTTPKPRIRRKKRFLPIRALCIIREFSKPITRADWRNSRPIITIYGLYTILKERELYNRKNIYDIILKNIKNNTPWYKEYLAKKRIKRQVRLAKEDNIIKSKVKIITSHTFYNLSNTDHKILSNIISLYYYKTYTDDYNNILDEIIMKINSGQYSIQSRYNISLY